MRFRVVSDTKSPFRHKKDRAKNSAAMCLIVFCGALYALTNLRRAERETRGSEDRTARALRSFFEASRARHLIAPAGFFHRAESDSSLVIWEQVEAGATHGAEPERAGDAPT